MIARLLINNLVSELILTVMQNIAYLIVRQACNKLRYFGAKGRATIIPLRSLRRLIYVATSLCSNKTR